MTGKVIKTSGEQALTPKEVDLLLSSIDQLPHKGLIMLAITGALRREDIVGVKKADVRDGKISFYEHKKDRIWTVNVPPSTFNTLEMIKRWHPRSVWLFPSANYNKHISSKTAYNILQKYLDRRGLRHIPFHSLRATCVKLCIAKGWSREQIARHLGDRPETIERHYSIPSEGEMVEISQNKPLITGGG